MCVSVCTVSVCVCVPVCSADLQWLRQQRFDQAIYQHVLVGKPLLGICGGLQMLGDWLHDPFGVEGALRYTTASRCRFSLIL